MSAVNRSILVVDDSLTVRMELLECFEGAGLEAAACEDLEGAREELVRGGVRLLILDLLLPDGDGLEFLRELRSDSCHKDLPVLLLTTESETRERLKGLEVGADDYIGKPYDAGFVVRRASEILRREAKSEPAPAPARTLVLLIDDSPTVHQEVGGRLQDAGYEVLHALTGEEGLRLAESRRPAAAIVDGHLPGIEGRIVVQRLKQDAILGRIPCIILTGSADPEQEIRLLEAGADDLVRKEQGAEVLLARLGILVRHHTPHESPGRSLLGAKRILIADDSPTYLEEMALLIRGDGFDVVKAPSGEDALAVLDVQTVDAVLLDQQMDGIDGLETCRRIRQRERLVDLPVIMVTSNDDPRAMMDAMAAGANDFISKATHTVVLRARLWAQLRRQHQEDEFRRIQSEIHRKEMEAAEARAARVLAEARSEYLADIERKNIELGELNRQLESFSYSVSHDLRAPLRHVTGFATFLKRDAFESLGDKNKERLNNILQGAERMDKLIQSLLQLSRTARQIVKKRAIDLGEMVNTVREGLDIDKGDRRIDWEIAGLPTVDGDPVLLRQVLENLMSNAVKYSREVEVARIQVREAEGAPGETVIEVKDNGAGFDMAHAERLFGAFQRLHPGSRFEGIGVGLANVRTIVARHGGRTWARAAPGEGASFFFSLPRGGNGDERVGEPAARG